MKKLIAGIILAVAPIAAYAACVTNTYFINGKYIVCTTCCYGGNNCNTTCI